MANKAADVSWTVLTPRDGGLFFNEGWLLSPLRWRRPKTVIIGEIIDLFHEDVPDDWIDKVFAVMALAPQHQFMVLTKRAKRMREYLSHPTVSVNAGFNALGIALENPTLRLGKDVILKGTDITPGALKLWPLPNVALGVTAEDQERADERIPDLLATPAAKRFVSIEPMLGAIDLTSLRNHAGLGEGQRWLNALGARGYGYVYEGVDSCPVPRLDLVICGGESGPNARPMHPDWPRSLRDQCATAGVPFNFKQWGNWAPEKVSTPISEAFGSGAPYVAWADGTIAHGSAADHGGNGIMLYNIGKRRAGCLLDGVEHDGVLP